MEARILSGVIIEHLIKLAKRETWADQEDFDPQDFSGGNFDDAYYNGSADGESQLARDILNQLNIDYKE